MVLWARHFSKYGNTKGINYAKSHCLTAFDLQTAFEPKSEVVAVLIVLDFEGGENFVKTSDLLWHTGYYGNFTL